MMPLHRQERSPPFLLALLLLLLLVLHDDGGQRTAVHSAWLRQHYQIYIRSSSNNNTIRLVFSRAQILFSFRPAITYTTVKSQIIQCRFLLSPTSLSFQRGLFHLITTWYIYSKIKSRCCQISIAAPTNRAISIGWGKKKCAWPWSKNTMEAPQERERESAIYTHIKTSVMFGNETKTGREKKTKSEKMKRQKNDSFFFLALLDEEMWHANYRLIHPFPLWSRGGGGGWHVQTHASAKIASAARKSPPSLFSPFPSRIYLYLQIDFFYYIYIYSISPLPHHHHHLSTVCVSAVCRCWQSWISLRFPGAPVSFRCQRWPPARLFQSFLFETETLLLLLLLTKIRTSACCLNVAGQRFVGYG